MKYIFIFFFLFSTLFAKSPSLDEMIGQMIMVGVSGSRTDEKWVKKLKVDIEQGKVGGVLFFANNIQSPKQLKELTTFLSPKDSKYPPFIAVDQEGGEVQRLNKKNGFSSYPSAEDIAKNRTLAQSYEIYKKMSDELKEYGFNLNFAPVVDLNINQKSPAIGAKKRSYSAYEEIVIAYSSEFLNASSDAGIISVLKHFPGHGSALNDSHKRLTDVSKTWEYRELKPYYNFIKYEKVDAIMVGHINLDIFDSKYPASLSKRIIEGLLRGKLGFKGVVFSDDMNMKAISDIYGFKNSIILAINAGVDVLVYSSYFTKNTSVINDVTKIIKSAVKNGEIREEKIINSYKRIVGLKNGIN